MMSLEESHEDSFGGFGLVSESFSAHFEPADLGWRDVMFFHEILDD